jgi:GNAT superfamily N-acetyltransferase
VEVLSVHLLADHPNLISDVGILKWKEWGYGDPDPQSWIKVTAAEAGGDRLPITLVAIDSAGRALGAVALGAADPELNDGERGDRSPWLLGLVVRQQDRRRGIGGLLVSKLERLAADLGYRQVWVATGGEAVEFYRQCGWRDAHELRLVGTRIQTTILNKRVGTTLT